MHWHILKMSSDFATALIYSLQHWSYTYMYSVMFYVCTLVSVELTSQQNKKKKTDKSEAKLGFGKLYNLELNTWMLCILAKPV